jgi:hypothetical protein
LIQTIRLVHVFKIRHLLNENLSGVKTFNNSADSGYAILVVFIQHIIGGICFAQNGKCLVDKLWSSHHRVPHKVLFHREDHILV